MLNFGYRFSDKWGVTVNWMSSSHGIEDSKLNVNFGYVAVGPMFTLPLNETFALDIKPQYAFGLKGKYDDDFNSTIVTGNLFGIELKSDILVEDYTMKGHGFLFGTSLNYGMSRGVKFSINLDYLAGEFNEQTAVVEGSNVSVDYDKFNTFSNLSIGFGVRYNF